LITDFSGPNGFLSNFSPSPIMADGHSYPTVEHAFQAAKTRDKLWRETIRLAPTPNDAKKLGRKCPIREDWDEIKIDVMEHLLRLKFRAPALRARLLETGDEFLIEGNTWGDRYWGAQLLVTGWEGQNHLGLLLMKLREEFTAGS
jgi:N-glycosidase YbiA